MSNGYGLALPMALSAGMVLMGWPILRRLDPPSRVFYLLTYTTGVHGFYIRAQTSEEPITRPLLIAAALALIGICLSGLGAFRRGPRKVAPGLGWLIGLLLMGWLIAFFSSGKGGPDPMISGVMNLLGVDRATAMPIVIGIRKTIHLSFYGLLGLCAFRIASVHEASLRRAASYGLAVTLIHAVFDEVRQSRIPGRTGSAADVMLDLLGGVIFIGIAALIQQRSHARSNLS